jgi:hypothetical protein
MNEFRSTGRTARWVIEELGGTWKLETAMPAGELERADAAPLKVTVSFELPARHATRPAPCTRWGAGLVTAG